MRSKPTPPSNVRANDVGATRRSMRMMSMGMAWRALHVLGWMGLCWAAHAENGCPAGYEPWKIPVESASDCVAIPDYGQEEGPPGPAAEARWLSRWGAIAIGSTAAGGGVGTTTGQRSRRQAESAALKICRDTGGGAKCKVLSYHDQCAAVAWGADSYVVQSAESIKVASGIALDQCHEKTSDCRIYYSACSLPERAR